MSVLLTILYEWKKRKWNNEERIKLHPHDWSIMEIESAAMIRNSDEIQLVLCRLLCDCYPN